MFLCTVFVLFVLNHPCHPLPAPSLLHVLHQEHQVAAQVGEGESEGQDDQVNENRFVSKLVLYY